MRATLENILLVEGPLVAATHRCVQSWFQNVLAGFHVTLSFGNHTNNMHSGGLVKTARLAQFPQ
jgi:hypothetical protein